jgi:hypothetical protein
VVFEVQGTGAAADGLAEATASPGPVLSLMLDPKVKRMEAADLEKQVTSAFNAALHDLRANSLPAGEPLPDLASLTTALRDIQDQVVTTLTTIGGKINTAMAAAGQRARLDVAATVEPTASLLDRAREALVMAQAGVGADPDVRGQGTALDERVRAIAVVGRIETVEIGRGAMNVPAQDLADGLADAANAALRDLHAKTRASGPADRTELRERTGEIRDLSVENMRSFTQAIADLMARLDVSEDQR